MKTTDKTMTLTRKDDKLLDAKENDIKAFITNPYGEPKDIHDKLKAGDYVIFARLDKLNRVLISCTTIIKVNDDEVTVEDDVSKGKVKGMLAPAVMEALKKFMGADTNRPSTTSTSVPITGLNLGINEKPNTVGQ